MITNILIALGIGIVAGAIDTIPMLKQPGIPKSSVYFVFAQWVFIGLVTPFIGWGLQPWMKGMVLGILGMVPVMIIAYSRNRKKVPTILLFAAGLGAVIGIAGDKFI